MLRRTALLITATTMLGACAYGAGYGYDHSAKLSSFSPRIAAPAPANTSAAPETVSLGRDLFNDRRLSQDGDQSCASCHQAAHGFSDGLKKARGRGGRALERHTPGLWNVAFAKRLFLDGRAESLEAQALMPVGSGAEMGRHSASLVDPVRADPDYRARFTKAFGGEGVTEETVSKAIAAYERTLISGDTPFDAWVRGDPGAVSASAKRGFAVFTGPGRCATCHSGSQLSDGGFHDVGLPDADLGRGAITQNRRLDHAFRTPSLRDVGSRGPYMHDGSLPTLEAVVKHYSDNVTKRRFSVRPVRLTTDEKTDLIAFLSCLNTAFVILPKSGV